MKERILATLIYSDIFDYPLKQEEIWLWLVGYPNKNKNRGTNSDIKKLSIYLRQLKEAGQVGEKKGYYFLKEREKVVNLRLKRNLFSQTKKEKAVKIAGIMRLIPWVKLIAVTGGVAADNAKEEDDIDLFFITASKRLWLSRGLIVLFLTLFGFYRRSDKIKDMFCPNMFVAEDSLKIKTQDLFTAHEMGQMKVLFEKNNIFQVFLLANQWTKFYLPNLFLVEKLNERTSERDFPLISRILDFLDGLSQKAQVRYMRKKQTKEVVKMSLIKFHPKDVRLNILRKYQEKTVLYGLDKLCYI
ncbi:MAG: hypothetical protein Q7S03_02210 [bacterium]|nr:hypothetical protein [bacterium]